ncbi:type II toxin-antitoxin system RelB/DinJ family antitoxin [Aeromonas dhakensis]|uniref:type II toxin-antitoxin system RelB/DinJ family antitoxin n=1 Tax=Aeromonas dhakensis TaxID=196024 RepID=UPI0005A8E6FA|nr:type II toxin-antitoxin system RelB/DinJ family antitoxin [Aeromonas dhakensis]
MGSMNIRIDDDLKARAGVALEGMGVSASEAVRLVLEYVAINKRLPVQIALMADEDAELLATARQRLASPGKRVRVTLDDLTRV